MHEDICHGLALEIMPIDGCAPGKISRALQLMWAMTFALFNAQRLPDNKGPMYRALAGCIYKVFSSQSLRYHIWRFAEKMCIRDSGDTALVEAYRTLRSNLQYVCNQRKCKLICITAATSGEGTYCLLYTSVT